MNSASSTPPDRIHRARRRISRRFIITVTTLLGLIIIGVSGYRLWEGLSFIDSLYMTITTITTVGFGEVAARRRQSRDAALQHRWTANGHEVDET